MEERKEEEKIRDQVTAENEQKNKLLSLGLC